MPYFEVIIENGHMGAGNSYEVKRYLKGETMISIVSKIRRLRRVKKKDTIEAIKSIKAITRKGYILGKLEECRDPYLIRGFKGVYICPLCGRRFKEFLSFKRHVVRYMSKIAFADRERG